MANTTKSAQNKPIWNYNKDNPIRVRGIECGQKIFNINDPDQRLSAAKEIVCRKYLRDIGFSHMSNLEDFTYWSEESEVFKQSEDIWNIFNSISSENIKDNFQKEVEKVKKELVKQSECNPIIAIVIQRCDTVDDYLEKIAKDPLNNGDKVMKIIKELFNLVEQMERNNFVHGDLKSGNLLLKVIEGKISLVLNDFDSSYVLPGAYRYLKPEPSSYEEVRFTLPAPEIFQENVQIGYWTDVFVAGLISYYLLNNGYYPKPIQSCYDLFENREKNKPYVTEVAQEELINSFKSLFNDNETLSFLPPKNGIDALHAVILSALRITPSEREKASNISNKLNDFMMIDVEPPKHFYPRPPTVKSNVSHKDEKAHGLTLVAILALVSIVTIVAIVGIIKISSNTNISGSKDISLEDTVDYTTIGIYTTSEKVTTTETIVLTTTINSSETPTTESETTPSHSNIYTTLPHSRSSNQDPITTIAPTPPAPEKPESPTEDNSPFIWDKISLDGQYGDIQLYSPIDGIVIRGYKEISNIPSILEIPTEINGIPVICIDDEAFNNIDTIQEVIIPDSIYQINSHAFSNCPYLWHIEIGANVKTIGSQAFYKEQGCYSDNAPIIVIKIEDFGNLRQYFGDNWAGFNNDYDIVDEYGEKITGVYQ